MDFFLLSFFLGMRHAVEADHFSAVVALGTRSSAANCLVQIATIWGVGHTLTLFSVGLWALSFEASIPQSFSKNLEVLVGIMLVALGVDLIRRIKKENNHITPRYPESSSHLVLQSLKENPPIGHEDDHVNEKIFHLRCLVVGSIHGLAGSAALIVIALTSVESYKQGIIYILIFGIGSILGMVVLSVIITLPLKVARTNILYAKYFKLLNHVFFKGLIGIATIVVGLSHAFAIPL